MIAAMHLENLHKQLADAAWPEDVFGPLAGSRDEMLAGMKHVYRKMALLAHPDRTVGQKSLAESAFRRLEMWRRCAEERIAAGQYGTRSGGGVTITTRKGTYSVGTEIARGDYYTLHLCQHAGAHSGPGLRFKIVRDPRDNDLAEDEARQLVALRDSNLRAQRYLPRLVDAFISSEGTAQRRALIYEITAPGYTLAEIREAYPLGVDPRDAAWMFNRILESLWFIHQRGLVHGAVLPPNLVVNTENHGLTLCEYAYAVEIGSPVTAVSGRHALWYPPEVLAGGNRASPAMDIYLAARCLNYILGGDPRADTTSGPEPIQRFIRSCLLVAPAQRPTDAGALREEFDECLKRLYGKRAFRPFAMPT